VSPFHPSLFSSMLTKMSLIPIKIHYLYNTKKKLDILKKKRRVLRYLRLLFELFFIGLINVEIIITLFDLLFTGRLFTLCLS